LFVLEGVFGFFRRNFIVFKSVGGKGGRGGVYQRILRALAVFVVGAICGAVEVIELDYLPFHEIDCKLREDF
jgi:hypothetical protein